LSPGPAGRPRRSSTPRTARGPRALGGIGESGRVDGPRRQRAPVEGGALLHADDPVTAGAFVAALVLLGRLPCPILADADQQLTSLELPAPMCSRPAAGVLEHIRPRLLPGP